MKQLTYDQVASRKDKASRFVRDVLRDGERAAEIEDEPVEDYADRRKIEIVNENPVRVEAIRRSLYPAVAQQRSEVPMMTKRELEERVNELEAENEDLQTRLDQVADLVAPLDDDEEDEEADGVDDFEDDEDLDDPE